MNQINYNKVVTVLSIVIFPIHLKIFQSFFPSPLPDAPKS